jgi:hypothetical protein
MFKPTAGLLPAAAAILAAVAIAACGGSSPTNSASSGGHSNQTPEQQRQDVVRFAHCMRSHGVTNLPDPTTAPRAFKDSFNTRSPAFQQSASACRHLLPGGGPSSQSGPPPQARITALLAFARCLRSHGFPNFPDPSGSGQLSREMLAQAGVNLAQPAVRQAADACVGVTHGVITKAVVARFLAGH